MLAARPEPQELREANTTPVWFDELERVWTEPGLLSKLIVNKVSELPEDIRVELTRAAADEGFKPMGWLIDEWEAAINRFSLPGEALYEARAGNRLVGICGLNRDPFQRGQEVARLRRLYVHPEFRRKGVGGQLVKRAIEEAADKFVLIRLMTLNNQSAQFFEALGFRRVGGEQRVSHIMEIGS